MKKSEFEWSAADIATAQKLFAEGLSYAQIGERINRTPKGVRVKLKRLSWTPEQRYAYNKKERLRGKKFVARKTVAGMRTMVQVTRPIPPELLADREARYAAPQDLTGAFFGDPPKGFSALERRA